LNLLIKREKGVKVIIYTSQISKTLQLDLAKHNAQYAKVEIKVFTKAHDRFLMIDNKDIYHFGASVASSVK